MAIKIENTEVVGWEPAIRGMRNPKNSWKRSDSYFEFGQVLCEDCANTDKNPCGQNCLDVGPNDHDLMMRLANGGPVHAKYRRMITVYLDITAPLYWWKEFDTYKVGTVSNSCSTMHKIADKEFDISDFSLEHLETIARFDEDGEPHQPYMVMKSVIDCLNACRKTYLKTKSKTDWWQMIQLLPSSYNQKRTIMLNYEVLNNIYHSRKDHKLDEWRDFCKWIEGLPYSEIITGPSLRDLPISHEIMEEAKRRVLEMHNEDGSLNQKTCIPIVDTLKGELDQAEKEQKEAEEWFKSGIHAFDNLSKEEKDKIDTMFDEFIKKINMEKD